SSTCPVLGPTRATGKLFPHSRVDGPSSRPAATSLLLVEAGGEAGDHGPYPPWPRSTGPPSAPGTTAPRPVQSPMQGKPPSLHNWGPWDTREGGCVGRVDLVWSL